ncbi:MAG TPA: hypothetical protein VLH35_06385 [Candidatus Acidoferrales bacterium]|nr:hypothetical protein [Candidatus Acidoferrales bacterium]
MCPILIIYLTDLAVASVLVSASALRCWLGVTSYLQTEPVFYCSSSPLDINAIKTIQSGKILLKTQFNTDVPSEESFVDNTVTTTVSMAVEQKQVTLTKTGDSYLFSPQGYTNNDFYTDQWGIEALLNGGA